MLHLFAMMGKVEAVKELLLRVADLDHAAAVDHEQKTLLHCAVESFENQADTCSTVLEHARGMINVNRASTKGETALHICCERGLDEACAVLLRYRPPQKSKAKEKWGTMRAATHVVTAVQQHRNGPNEEVLESGIDTSAGDTGPTRSGSYVDLEVKNRQNRTALHLSACNGHAKVFGRNAPYLLKPCPPGLLLTGTLTLTLTLTTQLQGGQATA